MPHYNQGYCRCKDFFSLLVNMCSSNGWNIIDTNAPTTSADEYIVVQKVSTRGEIMTFGLKHRAHRGIYIKPSYATTMDNTGDVYTDAHEVSTHTLKHTIGINNNGNVTLDITTSNYDDYSNWNYGQNQQWMTYYNAAVTDTDIDPKYLFYIVSFWDDNFFIKVRGNPATANCFTEMLYCGIFELEASVPLDLPIGKWGVVCCGRMDQAPGFVMSKSPNSSVGNGWWAPAYMPASRSDDYGFWAFLRHDQLLYQQSPYGIPLMLRDHNSYKPTYATVWFNPELIMGTQYKSVIGFSDEQRFVTIGDSKYIYVIGANNHDYASYFIKVMDYPTNVSLEDTGLAYELSWTNPPVTPNSQIKICAQTDAYPTSPTLENTIDIIPMSGSIQNYLDSSVERYGQDIYYGIFSVDGDTVPLQASLSSTGSRVKSKTTIDSLSPTRPLIYTQTGRPITWDYTTTKPGKLTLYSNPILVYPCNDSAENNTITDLTGNYPGILVSSGATPVNTNLHSIPAKVGNGIEFVTTPNVQIRANNGTAMNYLLANAYGISMWLKTPAVFTAEMALWSNSDTNARYAFGTTNWGNIRGTSSYSYVDTTEGGFVFPADLSSINDGNFHHFFYACQGHTKHLWIDGQPFASLGSQSRHTTLTNTQYLIFASFGPNPDYHHFPGTLNMISVYEYSPESVQIEYEYNGGAGRTTTFIPGDDVKAATPTYNSGLKMVAKQGSAGEKIIYTLADKTSLAGKTTLQFEAFSSRIGTNFRVGFGNDNFTDIEGDVGIIQANTWETKTISITGNKSINKVAATVLDDASSFVFAIRNITANRS